MARKKKIRIAITAGDPAGIGPEVSLKALNRLNNTNIIPVLICRSLILKKNYPRYFNNYQIINSDEEMSRIKEGALYLYNADLDFSVPQPGKGTIETGLESKYYIDKAVDLWKKGYIDAVVTGPVNKGLIEKSGTQFSGHTEYIARLIDEPKPYMMMFSEKYRVLLVTNHIPVSQVVKSINKERLIEIIEAGNSHIRRIDRGNIKLAITGLDPHCGDNGAVGNFDNDVTEPAVKEARKRGINIEGPFSADTLFIPQYWSRYNLVIAHYHDQALIPFKILAFGKGVNITLGLTIVRTSVDHGTAFNIAGRDLSDYNSMTEAIETAYKLASGK